MGGTAPTAFPGTRRLTTTESAALVTKKDFARRDTRGASAAREAMAARYATSVDPTALPTEQLAHDPTNLRTADDYQGQSITELADSMRYVGVLEVLGIVRRETYLARRSDQESAIGNAAWVVVYGNRRLAAAHEAGLTEVPVRVVEHLDEQGRTRESRLIENIHHEDLDPLIEGYEVAELVALHGKKSTVAKLLGKSNGWVSHRLALANLVPQLQGELRASRLTLEHARALGAITQARQLDAWQAGPPYRDPTKAARTPAQQAETDTGAAPPSTTGNGRTSTPTPPTATTPSADETQAPEFYGVKHDAPHHADNHPAARPVENESGPETATVPLDPRPLATLLRERLSHQQRLDLVRLLQD